jgi:hypothetical protein
MLLANLYLAQQTPYYIVPAHRSTLLLYLNIIPYSAIPLGCKKGATHTTTVLQAKQKTDFRETFLFIENPLFDQLK